MQYDIDNIDFNSLLQKELSNDISCENLCLISKLPLDKTKIQLECGHAFNYLSIYKEIVKQKTTKNIMSSVYLHPYQIQCPYCRNIQNKILPYIPYDSVNKIYGVNSPKKYEMLLDKCSYIFKSGKRKNNPCNKSCNGLYCSTHFIYKKNHALENKVENKVENKIPESAFDIFSPRLLNKSWFSNK